MPQVRDARGVSAREIVAAAPGLPRLGTDGSRYFTLHKGPGAPVYGEPTWAAADGAVWRLWDGSRSKVAAAFAAGGAGPEVEALFKAGPVLYLGAASGTTVSHVADVVAPQPVFAVEMAARSFSELISKLAPWENVFPIHADARLPAAYAALVEKAGALVQDVASPDQVEILTKNASAFLRPGAPVLLFLKARSVDSAAEPAEVFGKARVDLERRGFVVREMRSLEPLEADHRAFFLRWRE